MRRRHATRLWLRIEDPGGPGVDVAWQAERGIVVVGSRSGHGWMGFDRAVVTDTDAGDGAPLAAVVALPSSAPTGSLVQATLLGAYADGARTVIAAAFPDHTAPIDALLRVAARVGPDARAFDAHEAHEIIRRARERHRRRVAAGRHADRPAWLPIGLGRGSIVATGQSAAEGGLATLPPRFVRGLRDFLDDDERVLSSARRGAQEQVGLISWRMPWRARERRAALLVLTDRQVAWLVDHAEPDRYLMDWGVDVTLMPIEAVRGLRITAPGTAAVDMAGGTMDFRLTPDAAPDVEEVVRRGSRFVYSTEPGAVRRTYRVEEIAFDSGPLRPFHQAEEAERRVAALRSTADGLLLAAFYAPRHERVPRAVALGLMEATLLVEGERGRGEIPVRELMAIELALSPLLGRIRLHTRGRRTDVSYPSPLNDAAAAFVRQLRRVWANVA